MISSLRTLWCWPLLGLLLLTMPAGCERGYKAPIAQLQKSTTEATAAIATYYNALNQQERDLYFLTLLLNPAKRVEEVDAAGKETPLLTDAFDPVAIQARIALMGQLALYADRLSALAGNGSPAQLRSNLVTLGSSLETIQSTFADLANQRADKQAAAYITPIASLIAIVSEVSLTSKREKAMQQAILQGEMPINRILDFLTQDLDRYVFLAQRTGDDQRLTQLTEAYNALNRRQLTRDEQKKRLDEIQRAAEQLRLTRTNRPSDVLRSLRKAHSALVGLAKQTVTLDAFLASVTAYETQVDLFVKAAQRIQALRNADNP